MEQSPQSLRKHVVLLGNTNAGKSTLYNALTGQERSIVSRQPGTTTDPVRTAMELIPYGPIVLVDTAGLEDDSALGKQRMEKTRQAKRRADAALYVADAGEFQPEAYAGFSREKLPHLLIFTKCDLLSENALQKLKQDYKAAIFLSKDDKKEITRLREELSELLSRQQPEDVSLIGGLVPEHGVVVLVMPIDSEAPKGRLILPQVQVLRDCLDHGIQSMVVREFELEKALETLSHVDLVITDSQAFEYVNSRLPDQVPLTSFSMLLARQKGNFAQLLEGAEAVDRLPENSRILMLEGCTHNSTHEDIGRVKIPKLMERYLGKETHKNVQYEYFTGYDFPDNFSKYNLAIQCGGCMLNKREITSRLNRMEEQGLPVTNYGILLAKLGGILERCRSIFPEGERL